MANPNIINATSIYGNVDMAAITTSATALVTCGANKVLKINGIFVSNIHASSNGFVTIDIYRSSTARHLAKSVAVTVNEMLDVLGGKSLYLEENDQLRFTADANSVLEAVVTYEEIA
jgi:hypothetical protein